MYIYNMYIYIYNMCIYIYIMRVCLCVRVLYFCFLSKKHLIMAPRYLAVQVAQESAEDAVAYGARGRSGRPRA